MPWLTRADLSVIQELFTNVGGKRNTLQFRIDIQNFTNMISSKWGVSQSVINSRPLTYAGLAADGVPQFRMQAFGSDLLRTPLQYNAFLSDVWQIQLGFRYIFN